LKSMDWWFDWCTCLFITNLYTWLVVRSCI
jgi:hypothetical protein